MRNVARAIRDLCLPASARNPSLSSRRTRSFRKRRAICEQLESRQLLAADGLMMSGHSVAATEVSMVQQASMVHEHDGHARPGEMDAMLALVDYGDVTRAPVQSGKWFDAATWGGEENMPVDGDRVLVPEGQTLIVNGVVDADLMTMRVDGMLKFAHWKNSELRVDTMVVAMNGHFVMGTETQPIRSHVSAKLIINDFNDGFETTDSNSPDYDPYKLGNGLISHGQVSINGTAKTTSTTLAVEPSVGDATLVLESIPADWAVGDHLVIAGTTSDADGDESRTIAAIDTASNSVTLDSPLAKNHYTPDHTNGAVTLKVHVANTTRNAIIETATEHRGATGAVTVPAGDTAANRTGDVFDGRGHVMFMHTNDVQISDAGFYHLGRTNKLIPVHDTQADHMGMITQVGINPRARYALHFHRAGSESAPARVESSAVVNTPGWGFVNHSSHADMIDNIAYDVVGAGFVTEAGDEAGSFVGNISIRSHGSSVPMGRRDSVDDFGHGGHGFWFQGTGITVTDNVASGSSDTGIVFWPIGIDGLGDTVRSIKVEEFRDNTIYGSDVGFLVGQHEDVNSEFVGTTIFGVRHGLEFFYPENLIYRDTTIVGDLDNPQGTGIKMHHRAGPFEFYDTHIEGFERGFETPRDTAGNVVDSVYLNNVENFAMINGRRHFPLELTITGDVEFGTLTSDALAGRAAYNFVMEESESAADIARYNHLVLPYKVILDYDGLDSPQRMYFDAQQSPDHVVWPTSAFDGVTPHRSNSDTPVELRGKTNAELKVIFDDMTDGERTEMLSSENRTIYQDHADAYFSFAGGIRPDDSELTFPVDAKNVALQALLPTDDLALSLNASAPALIASSSSIDNMTVGQRSVSLSFSASDVDARQVLFEEGGLSRGLNVYIDAGRLYVAAWDRPAGLDGTFLSTAITANTAYSVTLVLDATPTMKSDALRGYLNGVKFASGSATQINAHASGIAWGDVNGKTRFHDGTSAGDVNYALIGAVDHLRIYNRAIDEDEIQALFDLRLLG